MTIWISALLLLASLAGLGYRQGALRVAFSLVGILVGALLAPPLGRLVKPLLVLGGLKNPVLLGLLPPLIVFVIILIIFKVAALIAHQKAEVYYKYNAGELRIALWERLNHRVGLCLGMVNGAAYLVLAIATLYPLSYWTYQMASPESDPRTLSIVNRLGKDLQGSGLSKVVHALDKHPPEYYDTADLVGLIYHHPLLEARLARYPAFLGLAERPEFQDLAKDTDFAQLRLKQTSLQELVDYPKVQSIIQNPDLLKTIQQTVVPNLSDLQSFLTNGVSQTFSEKILGRWNFDLNGSMMLVRKAKPNISAKEMSAAKNSLALFFARATFIATTAPEQQAFLKNMPKFSSPTQAGESQTLEGQWKGADGSYTLTLNADGKPQEITAQVQGDRLTIAGAGMNVSFVREN